jgi:hypothetical protein
MLMCIIFFKLARKCICPYFTDGRTEFRGPLSQKMAELDFIVYVPSSKAQTLNQCVTDTHLYIIYIYILYLCPPNMVDSPLFPALLGE